MKNLLVLLFASLFSFGIGFASCWLRIVIPTGKTVRDVPRLIFIMQNGRDLLVAEDIYLSEPPQVALGAMLSYVHKMDNALMTTALEMYPESRDDINKNLYIAHGRIAKLYRKLGHMNKADQHTLLGLQFVSDNKRIDENRMLVDVESLDEFERNERQTEANQ